jgi:hypothetical protein
MTDRSPQYYEGVSAYEEEQAVDSDNPYPIGSDEAMDWEDGRSNAEIQANGE